MKAGKLTERDAAQLVMESKTPRLVRDFRRLSLEKALEVWAVAKDNERQILRPMLEKKQSQLENRIPAERKPLEEKLKGALAKKSAPEAPLPYLFKKLLALPAVHAAGR